MSSKHVIVSITIGWLGLWAVNADIAPITEHRTGFRARVEYVKAVISKEHLNTGTPVGELSRTFFNNVRHNGKKDVPAHLIPQRLGGTGTEPYNIAPITQRTYNIFYKNDVENPIYNAVDGGSTVTLEVWPQYQGYQATRPVRIKVKGVNSDGTVIVDKTFDNPPTS